MQGYATMAAFNGSCAQLLHGDFKSHLKLQRAQPNHSPCAQPNP